MDSLHKRARGHDHHIEVDGCIARRRHHGASAREATRAQFQEPSRLTRRSRPAEGTRDPKKGIALPTGQAGAPHVTKAGARGHTMPRTRARKAVHPEGNATAGTKPRAGPKPARAHRAEGQGGHNPGGRTLPRSTEQGHTQPERPAHLGQAPAGEHHSKQESAHDHGQVTEVTTLPWTREQRRCSGALAPRGGGGTTRVEINSRKKMTKKHRPTQKTSRVRRLERHRDEYTIAR